MCLLENHVLTLNLSVCQVIKRHIRIVRIKNMKIIVKESDDTFQESE